MIRVAYAKDYQAVVNLLATEELPTIDLQHDLRDFFVEVRDNKIVGSIGLELYGEAALLRSMVVLPAYRKNGLASELVSKLIEHARSGGVKKLYLITNTAEEYFKRKGFVRITRDEVDQPVLASAEFNGLCPASSAIMMLTI